MVNNEIKLLQFMICKNFKQEKQDHYTAEMIHSNIYTSKFPVNLSDIYAITCWRKDNRFHKEVVEYATDYGFTIKSPHMDIEPVTNSVLFRWHKHLFPSKLIIEKPTMLTIKVILDWDVKLESCLMIEEAK